MGATYPVGRFGGDRGTPWFVADPSSPLGVRAPRRSPPEPLFSRRHRTSTPRLPIESPNTAAHSAAQFNGPLSIMRRSHDAHPEPPVPPHDG